jgi:hypothetical protein
MAAYYKVDVSLNTNAVEVGLPSPQTVNVTIPLVGPAGPQGPAGSGGGGDVESVNGQTGVVVLAAADVGAASTSHTHTASAITDLATSGNAAGLYDNTAGQVGAVVNDFSFRINGYGVWADFDTANLTANRGYGLPDATGTLALTSHTHAASDITSGVLDFDRIQQVLTAQTGSDDIDGPDIYGAAPYLVGGNLHALILASASIEEGYLRISLPDLAINAVGQVTVRGVDFPPYPTTCRVQITDEGNSPIFPATGFYEIVDGEEFTFRWNEGRWVMDLRPNPLATAVSHQIFKPNASGTLALNPMTTAGDIVVGGTSGAPARLALGTASQQLRVNSGATALEYFTSQAIVSNTTGITGADAVTNIVSLTQAEYNAIGSPDAATLFLITDP